MYTRAHLRARMQALKWQTPAYYEGRPQLLPEHAAATLLQDLGERPRPEAIADLLDRCRAEFPAPYIMAPCWVTLPAQGPRA